MKNAVLSTTLFTLLGSSTLAQGDYQKGVSYYQQGQYENAIIEFEAIVKEQPNYESGYRILGMAYLNTKQYDRAIQAFKKSVDLKKDVFVSHAGLGLAYFNSGRYQAALDALQTAEPLAKSPHDQYQVFHTRGSAAFNLRNFSLAVENLKKASSIQRGDTSDLLQLGVSYYQLGRLEEAEQTLQQVVALKPDQTQAVSYLNRVKFDRATAAIEGGKYQEALGTLRQIVERDPEDGDAWFNLGLAYLFSENLPAAEEAFRRNLRISPENSDSHDRLGYIYETRGLQQKALQSYEKAYGLKPAQKVKDSIERVKKRIAQASESG